MTSSIALDEYATLMETPPKKTLTDIKRSLKKAPTNLTEWGAYRYIEKDEQAKEAAKRYAEQKKYEDAKPAEKAKLKVPQKVLLGDRGDYVFTKDGDLGLPGGGFVSILPQTYATPEAVDAFYARRKEDIDRLETNVVVARQQLREFVVREYVPKLRAGEVGDATRYQYIELNEAVQTAEQALNARVKLPRFVETLEHVERRRLDLHDWYAVDKLPDDVYLPRYGNFPWKTMWAKGVAPPPPEVEQPAIAAAEGAEAVAGAGAGAPPLQPKAPEDPEKAKKRQAFFAKLGAKKKAAGL